MAEFVSRGVHEERARRFRDYLAANDLAALAVFTPENLTYLSGFMLDVQPWERPVACVIPRDAEPFLLLNELSTNHIKLAVERGTCWITDYAIYVEHPRQTRRLPTRQEWGWLLGDLLRRRGIARGTLGVDSMAPLSAAVREGMGRGFEFVPAGDLVRDMRLVKHDEELALIRAAAELTDLTQEFYRETLKPGMYVADVDNQARRYMTLKAIELHPGCRVEPVVIGFSGIESACPHGPGANSGMRAKPGDALINIVVVRLNGYVCENERTFLIGDVDPKLADAFEVMTRAQTAAAEAMVEGGRVCDLDSTAQAIIEAAGYGDYINHRTGHGIGLAGHEYPDDTAFNYRPLQAGMVFSSEPGIYFPGLGGVRHDDTVIVGRQQAEIVTRFTKNIDDLTIRV